MSNKKEDKNELNGLRQGPTKSTDSPLRVNEMASILTRLFPGYVLPQTQSYLRDDHGMIARTKSGHKVQPDFLLEKQKIIVEVDGQNYRVGHYTNARTCIDDLEKDEVYKALGWTVVRIPAYIQLDKDMIKFLFGLEYSEELYPMCHQHGFLHDEISLPADFCSLGLARFYKEMDILPEAVKNKILDTLKARITRFQEQGYDYRSAKQMVVPEGFKYEI